MDIAVRWSPLSNSQRPNFVILDVASCRLKLCALTSLKKGVQYEVLYERDKLPNYTAFDFSKTDPYVIGLGSNSGEAHIVQIDPGKERDGNFQWRLPVKSQRRCNSIAFSSGNYVATGLERVRNDFSLSLFDLNGMTNPASAEPVKKFAHAEGVASIKFFSNPDLMLVGVQKPCVRLYDLRESNSTSASQQATTRLVHNLAIDPLDEDYFISASPDKEATVGLWDRRMMRSSSVEGAPNLGPVMEIRNAIDSTRPSSIWSLRFSGVKRGCFAVLSNSGEVKAFEMAQNHVKQDGRETPANSLGGSSWSGQTYTRRTHQLAYPHWDPRCSKDDMQRIVACDFIAAPSLTQNLVMLSLRRDRHVKLLQVHTVPRIVSVSAQDEICLWKNRRAVLKARDNFDTSAEELMALQEKANLGTNSRRSEAALKDSNSRLRNLSLETRLTYNFESPFQVSSGDKHEDLLTMNFPEFIPKIQDALELLSIQRRRCAEGYSLDPVKNKQIVANDPWLVEMWDTIKRFDNFSASNGMYHDGIDLAFLGVHSIWTGELDLRNRLVERESLTREDVDKAARNIVRVKKYPPFDGHATERLQVRQLCLAICGWTFSRQVLEGRCRMLMSKGEYYKAIVTAVMRGFRDLAQELLQSSIQSQAIPQWNLGLAAVIACESVDQAQRNMCAWMSDQADDPYLKALLKYFVTGDWKAVIDMQILPLSDRLGCALKYVDDDTLDHFIKIQTATATLEGNPEGLVLTGLTQRSVELFKQYIAKFNDLQTAVLALSFAAPLYISSIRFALWRETYLLQLQAWKAFAARTAYIDAHTRRSVSRDGSRFSETPSRPVTLRCSHCMGNLAPHTLRRESPANGHTNGHTLTVPGTVPLTTVGRPLPPAPSMGGRPAAAALNSGVICPRCGKRMPHCGVCSQLLGAPDQRRMASMAGSMMSGFSDDSDGRVALMSAAAAAASGKTAGTASITLSEDGLARQALYCMTCLHVFHGHHARDWFARHRVCPVAECGCSCGILH
jgi:WD repeat-containing protein mio